MGSFIVKRILMALIIVVIVSFISFTFMKLIPGDAALIMLGTEATQENIDALRAELWLDRPVMVQYGHWLVNTLQGDFGKSVRFQEDVSALITKRLPKTFYLASLSFVLAILFGVTAGIISAIRRGSVLDQFLSLLANIGIAIPAFWLAIMGIYFFGLKLGWLPIQGYTSPFDNFWLSTRQLIMPVICMAVIPISEMARQSRSSMLEVIRQDYIRTARAKGLTERVIIISHALKNALIPVVTLLGVRVRSLIGGSVLIETVFNIPGMGRLLVNSVFDKDFVVVQSVVLVFAVVVAIANLIIDISYGWLDPAIRYE